MKKVIAAAMLASTVSGALAAPLPWEVQDARGQRMGRFLGAGFSSTIDPMPNRAYSGAVQVSIDAKKYFIALAPGFVNGYPSTGLLDYYSPWNLVYASSDCTGPAYADAVMNLGVQYSIAYVDAASGQVLLYPLGQEIRMMTANSIMAPDGRGACLQNFSITTYAIPVSGAAVDITTNFARPFKIR